MDFMKQYADIGNLIGKWKIGILILGWSILGTLACRGQNWDIQTLRQITLNRPRGMDHFYLAFSNTLEPLSAAVPLGLLAGGLLSHDPGLSAVGIQVGASILAGGGLALGLKYIVNRPRPFVTYPDIPHEGRDRDPSFPSGHSTLAFATATSLSLQLRRWYYVVPLYLWAGTVAYSRLDLGMHYPSDVAAGMLIGAGSAYLSFRLQHWLEGRWKQRHPKKMPIF